MLIIMYNNNNIFIRTFKKYNTIMTNYKKTCIYMILLIVCIFIIFVVLIV